MEGVGGIQVKRNRHAWAFLSLACTVIPVDACVDQGDQNNLEVTFSAGYLPGVPPALPSLSKAMAVKPEEGDRGAEKYLR